MTLLAALSNALVGCGGSTEGPPAVSTVPTPAQTPVQTPVQTPASPVTSSTDLQSFAAAWISYNMVQTAPLLQLTSGASGSCPSGGNARFDASTQIETLAACGSKQFPEHLYSGSFTVSNLSKNNASGLTTMSIGTPSITVANASSQTEFSLESGDIGGYFTDSDTADSYFFASNSLIFKAGQVSRYVLSNAGSTSIVIAILNGQPDRSTNNLVFTTNNGKDTWQVQVMSPVHEAGTARPDRGSLLITRLGATQALSVSFGTNNNLTLSGGEDGAGSRTFNWSDAVVQAALEAGRK
ncbi:hypothetical protein [Massilia sp. S19_KUP03_FR1]|uniref:hypothetical protein n=1 Tax=Massilia sp. S19_KUP03_FR1 TaxID=3025503 RepID=UPI002FCD9AB8